MDILKKLQNLCGYELTHEIYTLFGEIVSSDELCIVSKITEDCVFKVFCEDTQEIVYKTDENGKVEGIVTFGEFIRNYGQGKPWLNKNFQFLYLKNINANELRNIFNKNRNIIRIPILTEKGEICFEIRKYKGMNGKDDRRKQLLPFAKLRNRKIPCMFVRRPEFIDGYIYSIEEQYRIKQGLSFTKMRSEIEKYEKEFRNIIGQRYSKDYVEKLSQIPPVIKDGMRLRHADVCSEFVNVIGGHRITIGVPEKYDRHIHTYGRCGVFGYAVEDIQTIPSRLQELCNRDKRNVCVENHGIWGTDDILNNLLLDIEEGIIQDTDIVLIYAMTDAWWYKNDLENIAVCCWDTTEKFHEFLNRGNTFYEIPGHMTAEGYAFIASLIYEKMKDAKLFESIVSKEKAFGENIVIKAGNMQEEIKEYLNHIRKVLPVENLCQAKTGAIVMNCNPFTLGHRYLVEKAAKYVDYLIVFVVEEDKSFFSFTDRIEMVRQGTKDISNVYVVPSGNYILSALTFPGYFLKEQYPDIKMDVSEDVKIFGKYIAPALHITIRFAGTEPLDKVTARYHIYLKKYLEEYNVEFCEIPRLKEGDKYISASMVRSLLKEEKYEQIRKYVPATTFMYLQNMNEREN